jgi:hypothetical protein
MTNSQFRIEVPFDKQRGVLFDDPQVLTTRRGEDDD